MGCGSSATPQGIAATADDLLLPKGPARILTGHSGTTSGRDAGALGRPSLLPVRPLDPHGPCQLLSVIRCRMDRAHHLHPIHDPPKRGESLPVGVPHPAEVDRWRFSTVADARRGVFSFIEGSYNTRRLPSTLGYVLSANYEKLNHAPRSAAAGPGRRKLSGPLPLARFCRHARCFSPPLLGRRKKPYQTQSTPRTNRP